MIIVIYPVCSTQLLFNMANKVHNQNAPDETMSQGGAVDKFLGLQHNSHFFCIACFHVRSTHEGKMHAYDVPSTKSSTWQRLAGNSVSSATAVPLRKPTAG